MDFLTRTVKIVRPHLDPIGGSDAEFKTSFLVIFLYFILF